MEDLNLQLVRDRAREFRNLLVHRYWSVRDDLVLRYARENLGDFEAFLESVGRYARIEA
jgi:uncharacterized protein YutE (UPF0331/DUF86 family)